MNYSFRLPAIPFLRRIVHHLRLHCFFYCYLGGAFIFLLLLNVILWPTPDEYFYHNVSNAFATAWRGEMTWQDINTEHVALVPFLSFLFDAMIPSDSFVVARLPLLIFPLGALILIYVMAPLSGLPSRYRTWWLWAFLLMTGFWIFSVRMLLDIPSFFGVSLVVYLLLRRAHSFAVGAAVLLLFLLKEYHMYLMIPVITFMILFDVLRVTPQHWGKKILRLLLSLFAVFAPTLIVVIIFMFLNILPYPRLVETSAQVALMRASAQYAKLATLTHTPVPSVPLATVVEAPDADIIPNTDENDSAFFIPDGKSFDVTESAAEEAAEPPTAMIQQWSGPSPSWAKAFVRELWLVYRFNFSEDDLNIFVLPFAFFGFVVSLGRIRRYWRHEYARIRPDLLFGFLFLTYFYFNYAQAEWGHGFRITVPILLSLIFYGLLALDRLLHATRALPFLLLGCLTGIFIMLYLASLQDVVYGGTLATTPLMTVVLRYKPMIYAIIFVGVLFTVLLCIARRVPWKMPLLAGVTIFLFVMKFGPLFLDAALHTGVYAYDFGGSAASPFLTPIALRNEKIYANMNPYRLQYYADDPRIRNGHAYPLFRKFSTIYPQLFFGGVITSQLPNFFAMNGISYLFVSAGGLTNHDLRDADLLLERFPEHFTEVARYEEHGNLHWRLIAFSIPENND